jgi:alkanesulfonate monooxygenase SsuD/methylene tetrahydromethanopterin reductase-like flavin-dependent oxidoreductase (luciferase family)
MEFGINFFPTHRPEDKPQAQYYAECMKLIGLIDPLGYTHVRTVEHYFMPYGASPNPMLFLTAASQHTQKAKLITGAILPVFNNPLKLAGEIGMLDALSKGRLEVGIARAFLPHEFDAFGISLDESRARFNEGVAQIAALLERENVTMEGRFHSFKNITSLPRPTQRPRPPFWVAAFSTEESFLEAGRRGDWMMCIPTAGPMMAKLIGAYREGWRSAGHEGSGRVMLAHHMYCSNSRDQVVEDAKEALNFYLASLMECMEGWAKGRSTKDYPGYDKAVEFLRRDNFDNMRERGIAWCGTPDEVAEMISSYYGQIPGGIDVASVQVNFHNIPVDKAERSMRLFAEKVMCKFSGAAAPARATV